jgi:hypothetical protein
MQFCINKIFSRIILLFLSVQILNVSIDTKDSYSTNLPEDLEFNDQESIVEFILEKCFKIENAIQEHDENDQEDGGSIDFQKNTLHLDQHLKVSILVLSGILNSYHKSSFLYLNSFFKSLYLDIIAPPPKYS